MPGMSSTPSKKKRPASKGACASSATLKAKQAAKDRKHKHFAMLLQEAGVSSSEDSFDQGYWMKTLKRETLKGEKKLHYAQN